MKEIKRTEDQLVFVKRPNIWFKILGAGFILVGLVVFVLMSGESRLVCDRQDGTCSITEKKLILNTTTKKSYSLEEVEEVRVRAHTHDKTTTYSLELVVNGVSESLSQTANGDRKACERDAHRMNQFFHDTSKQRLEWTFQGAKSTGYFAIIFSIPGLIFLLVGWNHRITLSISRDEIVHRKSILYVFSRTKREKLSRFSKASIFLDDIELKGPDQVSWKISGVAPKEELATKRIVSALNHFIQEARKQNS